MAVTDLDYAKVVGRFALTVGDTADPDDDPDIIWCDEGKVTFQPLQTFTKVAGGADGPFTAGNAVIEAAVGADGRLTYLGKTYVHVIDLTSPKVNPQIGANKATHKVRFIGVKANGTPVDFPDVEVRLTKDGPDGDGVNDLTELIPVVPGASTPIYRGEKGVGIAGLAIVDTDKLQVELTDGTTLEAGPLPAGPGGSDPGVAAYLADDESESRAALDQANADLLDDPASTFRAGVTASTEAIVDDLAADQSSAGFLRMAGTVPGSVPVVKPSGDTRPGVWEMTHNSTTGYLFHLLSGASMGHSAAIIALGVDNNGIGLLIPNKQTGRGIVGDQRASVTATDAFWLHATQRSPGSSLVRLEMQANDAAPVLELQAFGTPGSAQRLLAVGDPSGEAGRINAADGKIRWQRDIRLLNIASGETATYFENSGSTGATSSTMRKTYRGAANDYFFGATGSPGVYYAYAIDHGGSQLHFRVGPNVTPADPLNPLPSEMTSLTTVLGIRYSSGAPQLGFYGVTPVARPAAVADATDAATVITQLNALLARLRTIGLLTP